ncbi:electron transfer flavoprotein-ubiquinone oxidoreductase [Alteromonas sp. M12]|uniref:electron transfer flavoprotein-ubiquinone oxidoreductase n=1 Tax=Alteromonas sp. M12 TaxID=3135644 RepID=UPI00319E3B6E
MEYDVVIVGAGPSGLATACRLMQLAQQSNHALSVCVVEKGSEVGAHILSGAIIESKALDELFPDWKERGAPLNLKAEEDQVYLLKDSDSALKIPNCLIPKTMHNRNKGSGKSGNYLVSLGEVCRWLAEQAEQLGVDIFPGFPAAEILYHEDNSVKGVATQDMGVDHKGQAKSSYTEGMELHGKYTVFSEGCRGHLGKQLIHKFDLDANSDPQHYGLGLKELWDIDPKLHQPGLVIHGSGWPLDEGNSGGFFLYHTDNCQLVVGLIVDLNYSNPYLSPFQEFQRLKQHPKLKQYLVGGTRVSYGARAIAKGGFNSLPKMTFPGGIITGCNAGTLNFAKIKGTHTAMKSGMLAAESIFTALNENAKDDNQLHSFEEAFRKSWLFKELYSARNFGPSMHKFGAYLGGAFNFIDQNIFAGKLPFTLHDRKPDYAQLLPAKSSQKITYPKADGVVSFDILSSVFLSNTNHEEDQPCHLTLQDESIPINHNLPIYAEPAQRYCPAGVYEVIGTEQAAKLQVNGQNCLHCKTCDIKDPAQNITWITPEGSGGPNYPNM